MQNRLEDVLSLGDEIGFTLAIELKRLHAAYEHVMTSLPPDDISGLSATIGHVMNEGILGRLLSGAKLFPMFDKVDETYTWLMGLVEQVLKHTSTDDLRYIVAHELSHIIRGEDDHTPTEAEEQGADEQAAAWGYPKPKDMRE